MPSVERFLLLNWLYSLELAGVIIPTQKLPLGRHAPSASLLLIALWYLGNTARYQYKICSRPCAFELSNVFVLFCFVLDVRNKTLAEEQEERTEESTKRQLVPPANRILETCYDTRP